MAWIEGARGLRTPKDEEFPRRLSSAREAAGMLAQDLARKVGVTPHMISLYERGHCMPRASILAKLRAALPGAQLLSDAAERPPGPARAPDGGDPFVRLVAACEAFCAETGLPREAVRVTVHA